MPSCPHCSEAIEKLEGFVPQATLESRINAKKEENRLLRDRVSVLETQTEGHSAIVAERDGFLQELNGMRQHASRTSALSEAGLDASLLDSVEILYNSAGTEETMAEWLAGDGQAHPLLSPHFGGTVAPPATPAPNTIPATSEGTIPAGAPRGKRTPDDVNAYAASSSYRNLSSADKRAWIANAKREDGIV